MVRGFTLVELMIVVAIVAILAAIGYPSYTSYVERARRADAQGALTECSARMERFFSDNNSYAAATVGDTATSTCSDHAPTHEPHANRVYTVSLPSSSTTAYTIRVAPLNTGPMKSDGYLELDSTGARRWDKNNDGDTDDASETSWSH